MKRNLSRSGRIGYISVSKATSFIANVVCRWARGGVTVGDETKLFQDGVSMLNKALDIMTSNLDTKMLLKILEESKHSEFDIITKKDSETNSSLVNNEVLNILTEKALYWCNPCDVKDYKVCTLKEVFEDLGIPSYNEDAKDRCSYCISVKSGKKPIANSDEFTKYCQKHYNLTPQKEFLEAFEDLLVFNTAYYDKNGISEKILRKFIEIHRGRL